MKTDYFDFYQKDDNFKAYVYRYCKMHGVEIAEALTHQVVKHVADLYLEVDEYAAKIEAGCAYEMEDKSC